MRMDMSSLLDKLKPLSKGQEILKNVLSSKEYDIVGIFGPTGTGKSLFACAYGVGTVIDGEYNRFIVARPIIDVKTGKEYTSIELGELYYKVAYSYLEDLLIDILPIENLRKLLDEGRIIIADSHFLRGRTFDNSVILLDDVQSVYPEVAIEVIMRMGRNSRLIVAGDPIVQVGLKENPAILIREVLSGEEKAVIVDLGLKDIVRPGAKRGLRLALEMRLLKRELNKIEKSILEVIKLRAPDVDVITIIEFIEEKKEQGIQTENIPDALILVKEGTLGRLIGRRGERIMSIEKETGFRLRAIEFTLDLANIVIAIHPTGWIRKHIRDVDFVGSDIQVTVSRDGIGAFMGQEGRFVKFIDAVMKKLLNVGVRVVRSRR